MYNRSLFQVALLAFLLSTSAMAGKKAKAGKSSQSSVYTGAYTQPGTKKSALGTPNSEVDSQPKVQEVTQELKDVSTPLETEEELYKMAADILGPMVGSVQNDPVKMDLMVKDAIDNPDGVTYSLSPDQKQRLREIALRLKNRQH